MSTLLDVKGLTRQFGGVAAVNDVSFQVNKGDILGLIGPNGAGKSTTFNLITGFYKVSSGSIKYLDNDVTNKPPDYLKKQGVSRNFQHNVLFDEMSVYENVYMGTILSKNTKEEKKKVVDQILELMNLSDLKDEKTKNLPHGVQRMLGIGIALATQPRLLLLDEPLTGMNPVETKEAISIFRQIQTEKDITIVIVEHNVKAVMELCNRIVVLSYGNKLAEGTPQEVRNNEQVIRAYLGGS